MIEVKSNEKLTNADRIRNMDNVELAEFLRQISLNCGVCVRVHFRECCYKLNSCGDWNDWLESEVEHEDN